MEIIGALAVIYLMWKICISVIKASFKIAVYITLVLLLMAWLK